MANDPFTTQIGRGQADRDLETQFRNERIEDRGYAKSQYPAVVDRAAVDVVHGIAVGETNSPLDRGATIGRSNFPRATGDLYKHGLAALVEGQSGTESAIRQFDAQDLSQFGYRIAEFRDSLSELEPEVNLDRGIEALVEKLSTDALRDSDSIPMAALGAKLKHRSSASDLLVQLLSDPEIRAFGEQLFELVNQHAGSDSLTELLDSPKMTTVLWEHQRTALREWVEAGSSGYVDMATATGKTVLGLGAIALRYGELHPRDKQLVIGDTDRAATQSDARDPEILIVAGTQLLLKQWHREFDEHLDIPSERTEPEEYGSSYRVTLNWGGRAKIDFRAAGALANQEHIGSYDLVILDEAHQYSRSGSGERSWGAVYEQLVTQSEAVLAMSGSVETGWEGDASARRALEKHLDRRFQYSLEEARNNGVIAEFEWKVRYVPTSGESAEKLATQTEPIKPYLDLGSGVLEKDALGIELPPRANDFPSLDALRSFVRTNEGKALQNESDPFDTLSSALLSRRTVGWNQSVQHDAITDIVAEHQGRKTVILAKSYEQATALQDEVESRLDTVSPTALDGRGDDIEEKVKQFNAGDTGVLIGPGKLLGTGVDLPDAEVAINIATGNVTATLVQRIGRVLRNPTGEKEALFYHLVPRTTPENTIIPREDGHRHLIQQADFVYLGESIGKDPQFEFGSESVRAVVKTLREIGADHLESYPRLYGDASGPDAQGILEELAAEVRDRPGSERAEDELGQVGTTAGGPSADDNATSSAREELSEDERGQLVVLKRIVMDGTNSPQAREIRMNAIRRLPEFGAPGRELLKTIVDGDDVTDEMARETARAQLTGEFG